ncbi:hypothetical protein CPB85DRAFT_116435 [Mucidula mucida]|nr:hypothetical protein CPB85DRAFT_116435 [Mucidula mucida]
MDSWDYYPSPSSSTSPSPGPQPTCLPTTQLFGLAEPSPVVRETRKRPPPAEDSDADDDDDDDAPVRAGRPSKKPRTTRDFVPPDVSGLSKREARLVKNRAAAFLSRQRKREEFEAMEIRVAELEAENKQLRSRKPIKKEEEDVKEEEVKEDNPVMLALLCALPSLSLVPSISSDPTGDIQVTFDAVPCPSGDGVRVRLIETCTPTTSSSSTPSLSYSASTSSSSSPYSVSPTSSSYITPLYDPFLLSEPQDDLDFAFQDTTTYQSERKMVRISRQGEEWVVRMC